VKQEQTDMNMNGEFEHVYEQVAKAKEEWQNTVDSIPDMICILDKDGRILRVNRAFSTRLHKTYDVLIGAQCSEVIHSSNRPPSQCPFRSVITAGKTVQQEEDIEIDGSLFAATLYPFYNAAGELQGAVHIFRDITDQKRLKDQLIQAEKMAAVGTFAAEIAHEINNPLDYTGNYLYLLSESLPPDFEKREYLEKIQKGIDNLSRLAKDLLEFSRPQTDTFSEVDLQRVISASLEYTARQIADNDISVTTSYGCPNMTCLGSERMLLQVFVNLIQNALDALTSGGYIKITTSCDDARSFVEIRDSGSGIAAKNISKIFEPFFTTKRTIAKRGTGLGLTISHNIIKQHGGHISVSSEEGRGTTFTITLPAIQ
jgi:PAS domain S-box-containing protein